jgi:hypothetical protein
MEERERIRTSDDEQEDDRAGEREGSSEPERSRADEGGPQDEAEAALLSQDRSSQFEERWREIQTGFVDHPREAVAQADTLVADLMQQLTASFSDTRSRLESQWEEGDDDASTEDLRVALTRYRSFFNRLLSA